MKIIITLLFICLGFIEIGFSQHPDFYDTLSIKHNYPKFYIGLIAGPGLPLPPYVAIQNTADPQLVHEFAQRGFHAELNADYMIKPNLGIALLIEGSSNSFDKGAYAGSLYDGDPDVTIVVNAKNYYIGEYLLGIAPTAHLKNGGFMQFIIAGGLVSCAIPQIVTSYIITLTNPPSTITNTYAAPAVTNLGFGFNFSIYYSNRIYKSLNFMVGFSYTIGEVAEHDFVVNLINPGAGLSFNF